LLALGVWLFFTVLWPIIVRFVTDALFASEASILLGVQSVEQLQFQQLMERLSPNTLFGESVLALLHPATRALGPVFMEQLEGAVMGAPLPLAQSLLLVWPQVTGLVAGVIALFVATYVVFQRQEVRA
jgi:ABC-2 type transport system permease protein